MNNLNNNYHSLAPESILIIGFFGGILWGYSEDLLFKHVGPDLKRAWAGVAWISHFLHTLFMLWCACSKSICESMTLCLCVCVYLYICNSDFSNVAEKKQALVNTVQAQCNNVLNLMVLVFLIKAFLTIYGIICSPQTSLMRIQVSPKDKSAHKTSPCSLKFGCESFAVHVTSWKQKRQWLNTIMILLHRCQGISASLLCTNRCQTTILQTASCTIWLQENSWPGAESFGGAGCYFSSL